MGPNEYALGLCTSTGAGLGSGLQMAYILLRDCLRLRAPAAARGARPDMAAHGYNKFFGKGGLAGTAGWFDSIGMKPGMFHARVAATTEMAAGLGLASVC